MSCSTIKLMAFCTLVLALLATAPSIVESRLLNSQRTLLGGGGRNPACVDKPGWFSSGGPKYTCGWHAGANCRYAHGYSNFGATAGDACCACGGGSDRINIQNSVVNVTALISNEITGENNKGVNQITGDLVNTGAFSTVSDLTMNVNAIISNVIVGDSNRNILNVIKAIIGDKSNINNGTVNVDAFAINDIRGDNNGNSGVRDVNGNWVAGAITNQGFYDIIGHNGGDNILKDIFVNVTGINYNTVGGEDETRPGEFTEGRDNYLKNVQNIEALLGNIARGSGDDEAVDRLTLLIDAILMNEVVRGNDNYLNNLLNIAAVNGISAQDVSVNIEAILVNQINGGTGPGVNQISDRNALKNIVDIGLGLCGGKACGSLKDFEASVSTILLNDVSGDANVIKNIANIDVASQDGWKNRCKSTGHGDRRRGLMTSGGGPSQWCGLMPNGMGSYSPVALKNVAVDVEAIIVNTLGSLEDDTDGDRNFLTNSIDLDVLKNVKALNVQATISAIIANTITDGEHNDFNSRIDLDIGDGSGSIWPGNVFGDAPGGGHHSHND